MVGTDPVYGTMYNHSTGKPNVNVPGQNVALKSGTVQIADEKNGGYLQVKPTISSVSRCILQKILTLSYVTVQQPETLSRVQLGEFANPISERASHERIPTFEVNC